MLLYNFSEPLFYIRRFCIKVKGKIRVTENIFLKFYLNLTVKILNFEGGPMRVLHVQGYIVLIDEDDYDLVRKFRWTISTKYGTPTPITTIPAGGVISMHRLILGLSATDNMLVSHKNKCLMDNRRENLKTFVKEAKRPLVEWKIKPKSTLDPAKCLIPRQGEGFDVYSFANRKKTFLGTFATRALAVEAHNSYVTYHYGNKYSLLD